jgi:hypothetical protein
MKTLTALFGCLLIANFIPAQLNTQLINKTWQRVTGFPSIALDWSASKEDANGNVIMVGNIFNETSQNLDFYIVKLSRNYGSVLWETYWNGTSNHDDYATDVAISGSNIYVCGAAGNSTNASDLIVLKLNDSDGSVVWTYSYTAGLYDVPSCIAVGSSNDVYVTGATATASTSSDYLTIKLNESDGTQAWASTYNNSSSYDAGVRLSIGSGQVYVTGASGSSWSNSRITTISYDKSGGVQLAVKQITNPNSYIDAPTDIVTDADENVYLCGKYKTTMSVDAKVVKLDSDLNILWEAEVDGYGHEDVAKSISLDGEGHVLITGYAATAIS